MRLRLYFSNLKRRINYLSFLLRTFNNFTEIVMSILQNKTVPAKAVLKNGIEIQTGYERSVIDMIKEIWVDKLYTPPNIVDIGLDDVVVDIGANVGVFSMYAASKTKNKVLCFEPLPKLFRFLRENVKNNTFKNVFPFNYAVSKLSGIQKMYISGSGISGGNTLLDFKKYPSRRFTNVRSITLGEILDNNKLTRVDFLKMDCEGSEYDILVSSQEHLRKFNKISMEYHNLSFNDKGIREKISNECIKLLEKNNFNVITQGKDIGCFGYIYAIHK